jgi:steroid 5-alpha reductase family enzyme
MFKKGGEERMTKSKAASLLAILAVYILSFGIGAVFMGVWQVHWAGSLNLMRALFIADCIATTVVYIAGLILRNASVYDPYWSVQPPLLVCAMYFYGGLSFEPLHLLVLVPLLLWAIRLTANWVLGFEDLAWQDWRYKRYRVLHPRIFPLIMFSGIMLMPTCLVFLASMPLYQLLTSQSPSPVFPVLGGILIMAGTGLEHFADRQMRYWKKHRKRGTDNSAYIFIGLWKLMRHPNYLGEMLVWAGVLLGSVANFNRYAAVGAVLMVALFFYISIPLMERHMHEKTPEYLDYCKKVRCWL